MLKALFSRLFSRDAKTITEKNLRDRCIDVVTRVLQSAYSEKEGYFYHSVSQKEKDDLRQFVINEINSAFESSDPVAECRLRLVNVAIELGHVMVLSCTPDYALFSGISGELRDRVSELAKINDGVRVVLDDLGVLTASQAEMVSALNSKAHFLNLPLNAFNAARIEMGDWNPNQAKDWFKPLCIAYQIHIEDAFRSELGMPSILAGQTEAMVFSGFASVVLEGHRDPRAEWERRWINIYNKPSPFHAIEL